VLKPPVHATLGWGWGWWKKKKKKEKRGGKWKVYVSQYALLHCISHARKEKGKKNPVQLKSFYLREGLLHVSVKIRL
jgi:hypothetical protein